MALRVVASYTLPSKGTKLVISMGSVLHFQGDAIVNAANESCLGGGGVDGAISNAGGPNLIQDRINLPVQTKDDDGMEIRCPVGTAVLTGPNDYGSLPNHVIHAVGPNFFMYDDGVEEGVQLLESAYTESLKISHEHGLKRVGFSLLSAGIFRGSLPLRDVLEIGVLAIRDWSLSVNENGKQPGKKCVEEIHLCAFTEGECDALKEICDDHLAD